MGTETGGSQELIHPNRGSQSQTSRIRQLLSQLGWVSESGWCGRAQPPNRTISTVSSPTSGWYEGRWMGTETGGSQELIHPNRGS
jgi:hypothetical protein